MTAPDSKPRCFHPTPAWLVILSLAVTGFLFLSQRYRWFSFNEHKGWTVLIAVAGLGVAMILMLLWFVVALVLRRRFQFSLGTLLALVVVVALPFSWLAVEMKRAREQREAVDAIGKLGGYFGYRWEYPSRPRMPVVGHIAFESPQPPEPAWLAS